MLGVVAKYSNFTIYCDNIKDIYAIYCVNLSFCNSSFLINADFLQSCGYRSLSVTGSETAGGGATFFHVLSLPTNFN